MGKTKTEITAVKVDGYSLDPIEAPRLSDLAHDTTADALEASQRLRALREGETYRVTTKIEIIDQPKE